MAPRLTSLSRTIGSGPSHLPCVGTLQQPERGPAAKELQAVAPGAILEWICQGSVKPAGAQPAS